MHILQNRMHILELLGSRMHILMPTQKPVQVAPFGLIRGKNVATVSGKPLECPLGPQGPPGGPGGPKGPRGPWGPCPP